MKVLVPQSCLTLCDPMDCSLPGSSVHGILQARILERVAIPFSRDLLDPGIEPRSPVFRQILYHLNHQRSPYLYLYLYIPDFMVAQTVKRLLTMQETRVWSLGREDPLEKEMATHSSTLAWKIPWTEEPGRLQSIGLQSRTWLSDFTFTFHFMYASSVASRETEMDRRVSTLYHLELKIFNNVSSLPSLKN